MTDEAGDPVEGATVILRVQGAVDTDTTTTDADGYYELDGNNVGSENGDTLIITASKLLQVGSETFVQNVSIFRDHNITLSEVAPVTTYNLTIFVHDSNGTGIASQNVTLQNALGTYFNVTTNSTGYAVLALEPGAYTYVALAGGIAGRFNQTGPLTMGALDRTLDILMDRVQGGDGVLNFLGQGLSKTCFAILIIMFALGLGFLFVVLLRRQK